MYTVISYKEALENNSFIRIYDDSTEKTFESQDDASAYAAYLAGVNSQKGINTAVDMYQKDVYAPGELDIEELKKQDALNKLTLEEKELLGL